MICNTFDIYPYVATRYKVLTATKRGGYGLVEGERRRAVR